MYSRVCTQCYRPLLVEHKFLVPHLHEILLLHKIHQCAIISYCACAYLPPLPRDLSRQAVHVHVQDARVEFHYMYNQTAHKTEVDYHGEFVVLILQMLLFVDSTIIDSRGVTIC